MKIAQRAYNIGTWKPSSLAGFGHVNISKVVGDENEH
jgi:hypothetical protein